ncbi:hypothetical protein AGMMS49960_03080 [Betaproteobacteria bacterium]|nr:hypothetical protein AGMMS49543_01820 [Betaproteobacteria bacterium]GHT98954.1 hypothetical protein AGMMS49960_03080 [Betaproteobacteria bacterium]GHU19608.1 hypothetical protein AGMMS50243_12020 [Betaproteobacteria bacterium]
MNEYRLPDYLDHMQQAATDACTFIEGLGKADFLEDKRTQQAVIMSLVIIGEAVTKVMDGYTGFTLAHPEVPSGRQKIVRYRIMGGYARVKREIYPTAILFYQTRILRHHLSGAFAKLQNIL